MRKMTNEDVDRIVDILRTWKRAPLSWEHLMDQISVMLLAGGKSWSRQSLHSNESIYVAWQAARRRLSRRRARADTTGDFPSAIQELEAALFELQTKYDNLAIRHRQLIYNASMLPGGTRLLIDPLPDNTPSQKVGAGPKRAARK